MNTSRAYSSTPPGRNAACHDCGAHGRLTARQIAHLAGISETTVYDRLRRGVSGEELCATRIFHSRALARRSYLGRQVLTSGNLGIAVAVQIARAFPHRPPTVEELRARFDMSRATAYRWRAAFLDAMGLDPRCVPPAPAATRLIPVNQVDEE